MYGVAIAYILTFELLIQGAECIDGDLFHGPALCPRAVRREAIATDAPPRTHTRRQDVVGVQIIPALQVIRVQVRLMLGVLETNTYTE